MEPNSNKLGKNHIRNRIKTTAPVFTHPHQLDPDKIQMVNKELQDSVNISMNPPSDSNWSYIPVIHIVSKKKNSFMRLCGDYWRLNSITVPDRYQISNILDFSSQLYGATIFSKINLILVHHQISVEEETKRQSQFFFRLFDFFFFCLLFGLRMRNRHFNSY